ncbi:hypothetical protein FEM48_Zijuj12G0178400 [Ziziphus jujuba var. spinosa]|uniref:KIB1-4 beta-propeller domain-containing protein n=1 Tax=Ziziphus jujuba var. spinosa TaxID=714518 RepID=A0A978UER7_ZIZJJ|nr:hypothetical protein FEM48_Zijuj12G0178400 [Ziziphus jujuba var. spinosa]
MHGTNRNRLNWSSLLQWRVDEQVQERVDEPEISKTFFHGYKLLDRDGKAWEKVENLKGQALFIGENQAISLSAREFPEWKENSIYITSYIPHVRVYNLDEKVLKNLVMFYSYEVAVRRTSIRDHIETKRAVIQEHLDLLLMGWKASHLDLLISKPPCETTYVVNASI